MSYLFISDLHLSQRRPEKINLFKQLLAGPARKAKALYILGDLFDDFWLGCHDLSPPNPEIITSLKNYTKEDNTQLFIMRGNREFHLNKEFEKYTQCQLIDDPYLIELDNKKILAMHGDTLCTDDSQYQRWRQFITHPIIKWVYAHIPLVLKKQIQQKVRAFMIQKLQEKPPEITDVSETTVMDTMRNFKADILIHGHTHRQAIHSFKLDEKSVRRIVLGDWYKEDSVLIYDKGNFRLERITNYIQQG